MDLAKILQSKFPQGSRGGECVFWLRHIYNQPAMGVDPKGNDVNLKFKFVEQSGIIAGNIAEIGKGFRIGDCVFTTDGATKHWYGWTGAGHEFTVIGFDRDNLIAAESNFSLDGRVSYGRRVMMSSPKIIGLCRFPFLIDLGLPALEINYDVFINNQPKWNLKVLDDTAKLISQYTSGRLKINFFPLGTEFADWWYNVFVFNGVDYKVIARAYLEQNILPLSFSSHNLPADLVALIVSPAEWQGTISSGAEEIAWSSLGRPRLVQGSCAEADISPSYPQMPRISHILIHELAHHLAYINGQDDLTDYLDNQNRTLNLVFDGLDFNRVALNL
jgi:hypothetical protein